MEFHMKENGFLTHVEYGTLHISSNEEYGFRPYQLMVSSIAVCSGGVMKKILLKMRMPFDDIKIKVEIERNEQRADRIEKIHMHYQIWGKDIPEEKMDRVLMLTRKNCSMVQSVEDSMAISESFEIIRTP